MKKIICSLIIALFLNVGHAQNFYYKLDIGTYNIYSFAIANLATAGLNYWTDRMLFDNSFNFTLLPNDNTNDIRTKYNKINGITARDLFSDITAGGKLGYQSFYPGVFNWGLFVSAHYRINQFRAGLNGQDESYHNNIQHLLVGGGFLFSLGDIESSTRFIIEAALRYELPMFYQGNSNMKADDILNRGLSSHFAIRINGKGFLQGLGVFADIPYYDLYRKVGTDYLTPNIRLYTFGLIYTITPWKMKSYYH